MSAGSATPVLGRSAGSPGSAVVPVELRVRDRGTVRHDAIRTRRWELNGIAKVVGAVEVGSARLSGTVVIGGPLAAVELTAVGSVDVRGPMTVAGALTVRGALDAGATLHAQEATCAGPTRVAGAVAVDGTLRVRGSLRAPDVRCGRLDLRGTAEVPGTVVATDVDATVRSDTDVGAVVCRRFRLLGPTPTVVEKVLGREAVAVVRSIEAETATITGARVGFVRAASVVLGREAHVTAVEGRIVRAHPTSRVGPQSWSRPPEGLRR